MMRTKGVIVYIQMNNEGPAKASLELLGTGRKLADDAGTWLGALAFGAAPSTEASDLLASYGADCVLWGVNPLLDRYESETFTKACLWAVEEYQPEIMLFSATVQGRDLAPRVAAAIPTGLTADCTALEIDPQSGNLLMTRPAFGGNLMATIVCEKRRPQISTVRPGVMEVPVKAERTAETLVSEISLPARRVTLEEVLQNKELGESLENAEVIVSGGRGIGGEKGLALIRELADKLGGTVGFSRAAVDMGWGDAFRQVGQTGHTVHPRLYIACGISGAVQHIVGMSKSDLIIAINRDENAPIFQHAHYGIVGDLFKVIPEWIQKMNEGRM